MGTLLTVVQVAALGTGTWLWWTYPLRRSVELPEDVEHGLVVQISGSVGPLTTTTGRLGSRDLHSQDHEWVATLWWAPTSPDADQSRSEKELLKMRLGQTIHINRLGTVTLIAVNPPPLRTKLDVNAVYTGGWTHRVNVVLDPGVVFERVSW